MFNPTLVFEKIVWNKKNLNFPSSAFYLQFLANFCFINLYFYVSSILSSVSSHKWHARIFLAFCCCEHITWQIYIFVEEEYLVWCYWSVDYQTDGCLYFHVCDHFLVVMKKDVVIIWQCFSYSFYNKKLWSGHFFWNCWFLGGFVNYLRSSFMIFLWSICSVSTLWVSCLSVITSTVSMAVHILV